MVNMDDKTKNALFLKVKDPVQCHLFKNTPGKSDLALTNFVCLKTLEHESHLIRYILQCKQCGQLYFFEFYEVIDWVAGNDPQYNTYIPVSTVEEAEKLNTRSSFDICYVTPRLQDDWGAEDTEKTIKWVR